MAIPKGYKKNFETLERACASGDLALVECQDKATKKVVIVLAAIAMEGEEYVITPMAKMFDGNPYEELNPPAPGGGFEVAAEPPKPPSKKKED